MIKSRKDTDKKAVEIMASFKNSRFSYENAKANAKRERQFRLRTPMNENNKYKRIGLLIIGIAFIAAGIIVAINTSHNASTEPGETTVVETTVADTAAETTAADAAIETTLADAAGTSAAN